MLEIILIILAYIILRVLVYATRPAISHTHQTENINVPQEPILESSCAIKQAMLLKLLKGNPEDPTSIAHYSSRRNLTSNTSHARISEYPLFFIFETKQAPNHNIEKICHRLD